MIVGIDLGTTNSLVAVWRDDAPQLVANALGSLITPSVVGLDDSGQVLVGQAARERLQTHPHFTASLFKRYMGSAKEITLGSRKFRSEELSALILRALKEDVERAFGEPVVEAVISVPAYFSDAQRKATRIAGELAGLKIEKLINEPTAAALAYGVHQRDKETSFLVFDLGGGTFDVSILELFEGVMEVRASAGDNFLGGEDFDTALAQHFVAAQRHDKLFPDSTAPGVRNRLQREAERVRHALGQQPSATFSLLYNERKWELPISQEELARICAELLERLRRPIERALRDARIRVADLNDILLVGGTTRMPLIRKLTATLFGRFPSIHINPDEAVALGAAVQAALKQRVGALEEVVLTDVCPYTLGIETTFEFGRQLESGHYLPIIERNTVVPVSRVKTVETLQDNQQHVRLQIYQGESRLVKDNILLGELEIPVPQRKAGEVKLDVRFTYDNNGILEAEVQLQGSPVRHNLIIEKNPGVLPPEEIHKRLQELAALKVHPREQQANTLLQARLERLYQENLGEARAMLAQMAATFQQALANEQDLKQIDELRLNILAHLDKLENSGWH